MIRLRLAALFFCILATIVQAQIAQPEARTLRIGVLSFYPQTMAASRYITPLLHDISSSLPGYKLTLNYMSTDQLNASLHANQLDFVLTDPRHALLLRTTNNLSGAIATLSNQVDNGSLIYSFGGVIFTRSDRDDISALRSTAIKSVAILSKEILGGYQAPLYEFHQAGVDLLHSANFTQKADVDSVVSAVMSGEADIGFLRSGLLESLQARRGFDIDSVKIINRQNLLSYPYAVSTRLYPEAVVLALPSVDTKVIRDFTAALLLLRDASSGLQFIPPVDYRSVETTARELRLPPFDTEPLVSLQQIWRQHSLNILLALVSFALLLAMLVITSIKNRQLATQSKALYELNSSLERRVQERVEDIENLVNASPDAILQLDENGIITRVNRKAEMMFGYSYDELLGENVDKLVPLSVRQQHPQFRQQYLNNPNRGRMTAKRNDLKVLTKGGEEIPVDIRLSTVNTAQGSSVIASIRDITTYKQMEQSLVQAKEEAERASQKKAEFLANMSHEIRTPLNGVLGMAELLEEAGLGAKYKGYLNTLQQSGKTLLTVINDILDYSKISEGKLEFERVALSLRSWVEALTLPYFMASESVEMIVEVADGVPEIIVGDETRLSQIFHNLLGNAFKFTEQGSVRLRIQSELLSDNRARLCFEIIDTGIGIPDSLKEKIFEKFEQADPSTTRKYGGTGLGLTIAKQLVEQSSGTISVHDVAGGGSRFKVELVFDLADQLTADKSQPAAIGELRDLRILLAEDNAINQKVAIAMLDRLGIGCELVNDGQEALEHLMATQHAYDCVFMDCEMPRMDGYEATRRIREWEQAQHRPRTLICALTAHAISDQVQQCMVAGMDAHLAKPLQLSKLEQFLKSVASGSLNR